MEGPMQGLEGVAVHFQFSPFLELWAPLVCTNRVLNFDITNKGGI